VRQLMLFLSACAAFVLLAAAPPTRDEVVRLIRQLGDDDFETRERASAQLLKGGESELPALRRAMENDPELEVRRRAKRIFDSIERRLCQPVRVFRGHKQTVTSVAYSRDGRWLVLGDLDGAVRVWNMRTGRLSARWDLSVSVKGLAISPDGKRIAVGRSDRLVSVWEPESGKELHRLTGHKDSIESVAFSPRGDRILSGADDVRLWDAASGKQLQRIVAHKGGTQAVAFTPDGKRALTGGGGLANEDDQARLWDLDTSKQVRAFKGAESTVLCVAISADGKWAAAGDKSPQVLLWEIATGKLIRQMEGHEERIYGVSFSPDGRLIASGAADGAVCLYDTRSGKLLRRYEHDNSVWSVAFGPDRQVLSGSVDKTARLWRAPLAPE
jgi:WD40 repeat protein